ncbi:DUF4123 domain-containing protein [Pseudomonas sp. UM16]|uniref:DUF4123 domain-containing protein n=1 Tax=Pseudomonas sp. UM16 TaxID=3158962 RepID=UPI00398FE764
MFAATENLPVQPPSLSTGNQPSASYLLVDGVMLPKALATLWRVEGITEIVPIYQGTRWDSCKDLGPILARIEPEMATPEEVLTHIPDWPNCASVLYSDAPSVALCGHLRSFIAPPTDNGVAALLRFGDPLVTRYWLGSYPEAQLNAVLGPIAAWHVPEPPHTWMSDEPSRWLSFTHASAQTTACGTHRHLGQSQFDALDQAWRWRFMEQLHAFLQQTYPRHLARLQSHTLTEWFDRRLDEADQWGLASARCQAIWVEYSLRWGEGFIQLRDSPYQHWLTATPNAPQLSPEQRIEQMDADCLDIELAKEAL